MATDYAMAHLYCDERHLDCRYDEHTPEDDTFYLDEGDYVEPPFDPLDD